MKNFQLRPELICYTKRAKQVLYDGVDYEW